jgi:hypothetical protein
MALRPAEIIPVLDRELDDLAFPFEAEYLKELDRMRDTASADARHNLRSHVSWLCLLVKQGRRVRIACESGEIVFMDVADFKNWCHARYPGVAYVEWPTVAPPPTLE